MSYKLRLEGNTVECDTAIEAIALLRAAQGVGIKPGHAIEVNPTPISIHSISPKKPERERVSNRVMEFLDALKESFPSPMTVIQMATRLNTVPKGLPAVVVGVRVLLKRWNVSFEEVIEWKQHVEGASKIGQYRLTSKGMKILQEQAVEQ